MPKEQLLNMALNRWKYNQKRYVGPTSESIRRCAPKSFEEWEQYYYQNVYPKEHLVELGKRFYTKVTEVLPAEIEGITEENCVEYLIDLVITQTYNGYVREKETIYGQLQGYFTEKIEPAPDEWDRLYNVDFYIQVGKHYIGLQVKPETFPYAPEAVKWQEVQKVSHEKFTKKYGGKVFFVISVGQKKKKVIANPEVIEEIREEIERLSRLPGAAEERS